MDYGRVYDEFIKDRRGHVASLEIYDTHHIVPRYFKGTNDTSNLIRLSYSDHLFAHILLAKIHGGVMCTVVARMSGMRKYRGRKPRARYQRARERHRERTIELWKDPSRKKSHSDRIKAIWADPDSLMNTPEQKERRRVQMLGNKLTSNPSPEISAKLGAAAQKRWSKPGALEAQSSKSKAMWTPERRAAQSEIIRRRWSDPSSPYNDPAYREKLRRRG